MKLRLPHVVPAVLMAAASALPAHAQDWGRLATISSTLGVNANRLCVGEGQRGDIGCPTYAPYISATSGFVGIGTNAPAELFVVNGGVTSISVVANADAMGLWNTSSGAGAFKLTRGAYHWGISVNNSGGLSVGQYFRLTPTLGQFGNSAANITGYDGAPSQVTYSFDGDSDTGMYSTSANTLGFVTSATERVRVDSAGNVGVGTTTPSTTLHVSGTARISSWTAIAANASPTTELEVFGRISATNFIGNGSQLTGIGQGDRITSGSTSVVANNGGSITFTTANNQRMVIGESGNMGIGTAAPSSTLHVAGTATIGLQANTNNLDVIKGLTIRNINGTGSNTITFDSEYSGHVDWTISHNQPVLSFLAGGTNSMLQMNLNEVRLMQHHEQYGTRALFQSTAGTPKLELRGHNSQGVGVLSVLRGTSQPSTVPTIYTDGSVAIGTASPTATLQVSGSFTVSTSAQTTTPSLYVATNGNVGIGIVPSSNRLNVDASGTTNVSSFSGNDVRVVLAGLGLTSDVTTRYGYGGVHRWDIGLLGSSVGATGSFYFHQPGVGTAMTIRTSGNVGISTTNPNAKLDVYGTISATNFVGDGSGLTGIVASSADRIVSGTTKVVANNGGNIDFMTGSTITGYYTPGGILAAVGISTSTNQASFTTVYASGNVGIGTSTPADKLHIAGASVSMRLGDNDNTTNVLRFNSGRGIAGYNGNAIFGSEQAKDVQILTSNVARIVVKGSDLSGNVGIGTTSPAKTLDVSGTAQVVSRTLIGGTGTPSATLQVSGSLLLAGNDNIPCTDSVLGLVRRNPSTGRLQACR